MYHQHAIKKPKLSLHARFQVGTPSDVDEQEAERVAEQVLAETGPEVGSTLLICRFSGQSGAQTDASPASCGHAESGLGEDAPYVSGEKTAPAGKRSSNASARWRPRREQRRSYPPSRMACVRSRKTLHSRAKHT